MLTPAQIEMLRHYDSPTICNAIERFNIRPYSEGFLHYKIKPQLPYPFPMIGYAATAKFKASTPPTTEAPAVPMIQFYRYMQKISRPSIAVFEDTEYPDSVSAVCGEVMSMIMQSLGCVGLVTNGGVRDMREVQGLGFGYFATEIMVSHAYLHCIDYNCPVNLLGTTVNPNDLLFCDDQGIVIIPEEIIPDLPKACADVAGIEVPVIALCKNAILNQKEMNCDILENELDKWLSFIAPPQK